jgi:hypothetical protein
MIRLHRNVNILSYDVEGTVARAQDRPELLAVARLALDNPGGLTPELLAADLIGSQPVLCRRILDRCVKLGLLERPRPQDRARLSELGREMLQRGQVLVPEQGTWRIYFVDDLLIDAAVVHVAPLADNNAKATRGQLRNDRTDRKPVDQGVSSPRVVNDIGKALCTSLVDGTTFQLLDIANRGARGPVAQHRLDVEYLPGAEPRVTLRGKLQAQSGALSVDHVLAQPRALGQWSYDELWLELVSISAKLDIETLEVACNWVHRRVLPTSFEHTSEDERRQRARNLAIRPLSFEDIGDFEASQLDSIELIPHTTQDAQQWVRWLQWDELDGYRVPSQLQAAAVRIMDRFPSFKVKPYSSDDLLMLARTQPHTQRARAILTPADLGLWS